MCNELSFHISQISTLLKAVGIWIKFWKVTQEMNLQLTRSVTEEEIARAVHLMNKDKAPGPDGLNVRFYKHHWHTLKKCLINFISHFFQTGYLHPENNHTHICLIPKIESPMKVKDYRSISLCNVAYKIISKILAERLKPWLNYIISQNQSTFISGRLITDNVLIAHDMLHSLQTKKIKPLIWPWLDIAKAFHKVEWQFVESLEVGFCSSMV